MLIKNRIMASCIKINSDEKKRNLIAMLSGDVEQVELLLEQNNGKPLPVFDADWGYQYYYIDSHQLAYVLYDALAYDDDQTWFKKRHIQELLDLHHRICPPLAHMDYSKFRFINYSDDYDDYPYIDEDDGKTILNDGANIQDVELTNYGVWHKEADVIRLLQNGATPYFKDRGDCKKIHPGNYRMVAPLLCHLDSEWCDQWDLYGLTLWEKDIDSFEDDALETIAFAMFNAAASQRMLYIIDKYITDEARAKGEKLMREYDAYYPILRHNPEKDIHKNINV
jgi:hypothetical protein